MHLSLMLLCGAIVFLLIAVMFRAARIADRSVPKEGPEIDEGISQHAAESLSAMIKYPTVSSSEIRNSLGYRGDAFSRLVNYLRARYPKIFSTMIVEDLNGNLLLYWGGVDEDADPMLYCANMDVISAEGEWEYHPFSGEIAEDKVWGRGAIDSKGVLCALLEAIESLIGEGFRPIRDVYIAIVKDAESSNEGARMIADVLRKRVFRFAAVFGKGRCISRDLLPVRRNQAIIGVAEKGSMRILLTSAEKGGSVSYPARYSAIGRLSEAICRIEYRPQPIRKSVLMRDMILAFAPYMPYSMRIYAANLWLFEGMLFKHVQRYKEFSSMLRTTFAVTQAKAGTGEKVLPASAEAVIHARVIHGDSCSDIYRFLADLVGNVGVKVEVEQSNEASVITPYRGKDYLKLRNALKESFGDLVIAPGIISEDTSILPYTYNAEAVYRITPFVLTEAEKATIHSNNERVDIDALGRAVYFYKRLISLTTG
jgi:carboxypeptidase PM20D1